MPRKGHSPEKILNKLRQVEVAVAKGSSVAQAVRDINVSENTDLTPSKVLSELRARIDCGRS